MVDIDDENREIIVIKKDFWHASLISLRARSKKRIIKLVCWSKKRMIIHRYVLLSLKNLSFFLSFLYAL